MAIYVHSGRYFVEANDLMEYQIEVRNDSPSRLEILTAIDGRNTLKDEVADMEKCRGMVVHGFSSYIVKGWRMDDFHTRPFVFTEFDVETVAKQATGKVDNLGVIAIAAYREKNAFISHFPVFRGEVKSSSRDGGAKMFSLSSAKPAPGVGTGMGDRLDRDEVGRTTFERDTEWPPMVIEIQAMPAWWLVQEGIMTKEEGYGYASGFPGSDSSTGYDKFEKI